MIDDTKLNSDDELFLKELETVFIRFVDSGKEQFNLEPMNSYKRRLAHKLASQFELETESIGEDKERAVLLKKLPNPKSRLAAKSNYLESIPVMKPIMPNLEFRLCFVPTEVSGGHGKRKMVT